MYRPGAVMVEFICVSSACSFEICWIPASPSGSNVCAIKIQIYIPTAPTIPANSARLVIGRSLLCVSRIIISEYLANGASYNDAMKRLAPAVAKFAATLAAAIAFAQPPATPKKPVTDTYNGVQVTDDYRWLENSSDSAVRKWSDSENAYARKYLDSL